MLEVHGICVMPVKRPKTSKKQTKPCPSTTPLKLLFIIVCLFPGIQDTMKEHRMNISHKATSKNLIT